MGRAVFYEWDVETVTTCATEEHDENEVLDHWHVDTFAEARAFAAQEPEPGTRFDVVLVRDDDNGDRAWAYLGDDGRLPERFADAWDKPVQEVPQRFHREVARAG